MICSSVSGVLPDFKCKDPNKAMGAPKKGRARFTAMRPMPWYVASNVAWMEGLIAGTPHVVWVERQSAAHGSVIR